MKRKGFPSLFPSVSTTNLLFSLSTATKMATSTRTKTREPVIQISSGFSRPISPSGRFYTGSTESSYSSAFASSTSSFSSRSGGFFHRSTSPNRVNLYGSSPPAPSVRFSIDRPISPGRTIAVSSREQIVRKQSNSSKKMCMCSPTNHPGSFRCSLHKNVNSSHSISYSPNRLNARRSAMTNSLVRIGTVEGDLVKRALAALIRPSSHQQRRRAAFQPTPSRLSTMSNAEDI